jgi:polyketide cyclase/dehydrase/lipid transport protein
MTGHNGIAEAEVHTTIRAPADVVFRLAAEIELWPAFVRQVRTARVVRRSPSDPRERLIEIRGWQGWLPIGWRVVQHLEPEARRITLRQVTPLTAGTTARWAIAPTADGSATDVTVAAHPVIHLPFFGRFIAERIVAPLIGRPFVTSILRDLKHVAEGGSLAGSG